MMSTIRGKQTNSGIKNQTDSLITQTSRFFIYMAISIVQQHQNVALQNAYEFSENSLGVVCC